LDNELDKLDSEAVGIVIDACYSGSAIPHLQQDGRVIVTSSRGNETAGFFSNGIATSLIGLADLKTGIGDNNGIVSLEEAYYYLMEVKDWPSSQPQIQDNYTDQLNLINLNDGYDQIDQFASFTYRNLNSPAGVGYTYSSFDQAAQSFQPLVEVLAKVRLYVGEFTNTNCPLIVSIRSNLTSDDLTSVSVPSSKLIEYTGYHIFDFPDIEVLTGDTYYIICKVESADKCINSRYFWGGTTDECYNNGKSFLSKDSGESWHIPTSPGNNSKPLVDLHFVTYGITNKDTNLDTNPNDTVPGFELIFVISAIALVLFWKRKRMS